jgi:hypothetical protein
MTTRSSIKWNEIASELDHAPNMILQMASKLWRSKHSRNRERRHRGLSENTRTDAQQQALWKAAYSSATDRLLYFGEFTDKGEHIRLLQTVKVVKRTAKQIHIVAAYPVYRCMINDSETDLWSATRDGGLFGYFYTDWKPFTRYRLLRVSKARLYRTEVLDIPQTYDSEADEVAQAQEWKRLCAVCLFANESEYARWHLARYEHLGEHATRSRASTSHVYYRAASDLYATLGLSRNSSQEEIKTAYQRMAMKHHPDRGGSADRFHRVKSAYDALRENRCG